MIITFAAEIGEGIETTESLQAGKVVQSALHETLTLGIGFWITTSDEMLKRSVNSFKRSRITGHAALEVEGGQTGGESVGEAGGVLGIASGAGLRGGARGALAGAHRGLAGVPQRHEQLVGLGGGREAGLLAGLRGSLGSRLGRGSETGGLGRTELLLERGLRAEAGRVDAGTSAGGAGGLSLHLVRRVLNRSLSTAVP